MASNNYAEIVTSSSDEHRILANFENMAARGCSFRVMRFNPQVDRFELSCWRVSNFPALPDVEAGGATISGCAASMLWKSSVGTLEAINFGNGYFGVFFLLGDWHFIAIPETMTVDDGI